MRPKFLYDVVVEPSGQCLRQSLTPQDAAACVNAFNSGHKIPGVRARRVRVARVRPLKRAQLAASSPVATGRESRRTAGEEQPTLPAESDRFVLEVFDVVRDGSGSRIQRLFNRREALAFVDQWNESGNGPKVRVVRSVWIAYRECLELTWGNSGKSGRSGEVRNSLGRRDRGSALRLPFLQRLPRFGPRNEGETRWTVSNTSMTLLSNSPDALG